MEFLTTDEVASLIRRTPITVRRLVKQGLLPQPTKLVAKDSPGWRYAANLFPKAETDAAIAALVMRGRPPRSSTPEATSAPPLAASPAE